MEPPPSKQIYNSGFRTGRSLIDPRFVIYVGGGYTYSYHLCYSTRSLSGTSTLPFMSTVNKYQYPTIYEH